MGTYIKISISIIILLIMTACGYYYLRYENSQLRHELEMTKLELDTVKQNGQILQQTLSQIEQAKLESEAMVTELQNIINKWNSLTSYDAKINMLENLGKRRNILIPIEEEEKPKNIN